MDWHKLPPMEIEKRSFEIITRELGDKKLDLELAPIIKRVIHTTADLDYADTLFFSQDAVKAGKDALLAGAHIVTDTRMAEAGINKTILAKLGGAVHCFMSDPDVAALAKERNMTRAAVSMEKAIDLQYPLIIAVGNAPTALLRLNELIDETGIKPCLIIGVPVGFVNVVESKEMIKASGIPCIISTGRKGGSNVAAAICNALLYELQDRRGREHLRERADAELGRRVGLRAGLPIGLPVGAREHDLPGVRDREDAARRVCLSPLRPVPGHVRVDLSRQRAHLAERRRIHLHVDRRGSRRRRAVPGDRARRLVDGRRSAWQRLDRRTPDERERREDEETGRDERGELEPHARGLVHRSRCLKRS